MPAHAAPPCPWRIWLVALLATIALGLAPTAHAELPAVAASAAAALPPAADTGRPNTLLLNRRPIISFHAMLLGRSPAERLALAQGTLQAVLQRDGPGQVTVWLDDTAAGLQVDGTIVFYLVSGDLEGEPSLAVAAEGVRQRLQAAVWEVQEMSDLRRIGQGAAVALAATGLIWGALKLIFALRRRAATRITAAVSAWQASRTDQALVTTYAQHAQSVAQAAASGVAWCLVVVLVELWFTVVLGQFAYTRPWAERSLQWLLGLLAQSALAVAGAVPGLLTVLLIFVAARLLVRTHTGFMQRVERGDLVLSGLDADAAGPTRRIVNFVIWLFALAIAYPFLPGANSEAFKGVSVLAGLMLSLGASSVVGQIISGLSLAYSRTLRAGEYVKIGEVEGTVTVVGMFATKVHTGLGEEVSLPNAVVFSQPVRNFSRLVQDGQFVLHTAVTIGYATPWRQVHAMLLEAARRVGGVAQDPPPYVVQTALSDFYVEYRLCAQSNRSAPRKRVEVMDQLHAQIQDVFNENGVQIMSPHYRSDPPEPQLVPPEAWSPGLASRRTPPPA